MQNRRIIVDPGHGHGNRTPGVFDPGAVRYEKSQVPGPKSQVVATEADLALRYAMALDAALRARGFATLLTRADQQTPCSLKQRLALAQQNRAALLVSLHLNASPKSQVPSPKSGTSVPRTKDLGPGTWDSRRQPRGHEVLYRTAGSAVFAEAVSRALAGHMPPHGAGVVRRADLYVLLYDPSVLVEVGFLDSDEDYALLADDLFKVAAMEAVAQAIADCFLARSPWPVGAVAAATAPTSAKAASLESNA